ncbi:MXAN_2562 family outer membrane beta-barrel protein [Enhygromyxa salina]|uniref:Uncharacterized protein n=1 Tax=Enhygromyxa salina TaxID=215803 RepID=A0A2S9YUK0_9BACT|nr:MXAN_2562 family outer membrane beta-barrel protein [Enhygromyxa salina]PRQ08719.1 hypothetical protein ENSA7_15370 [Enhygromyxa salina]
MSAVLLASLVFAFAAPPPPPPSGDDDVADPAEDELPPEPAPEAEPAPAPAPAPTPAPDVPLDERYDPILPYGDAEDQPEFEYADETPPPPELEYADQTPPDPEIEYDQTRQRPSPADSALARESDQQNDLGKAQFQGRVESPQRFAVEIKFGPYLPDVDRRYTGEGFGPYANIYGRTDDLGMTTRQPAKGLFSVVSFEWQFVHFGGPFSVGTTVGLFRDRADALIAEPVADGESLRSQADKTRFSVVPVTLLLGYRFELLADRFRVPLVPYARGGVAYGFWWERKGSQLAVNAAGQKARGGSWGWQANLGLMLRLDFIERGTAIDLDRLTGINHTYIFGEWQFSHLDGFGSDTAMAIGDDTFLLGLAFEF